jgi:hypothetical protein
MSGPAGAGRDSACRELPRVRLKFVGFWDDFDTQNNSFTRLLARRFRVEICDDPDFIVYAYVGGRRKHFRRYDCVRIFFTGENLPPDWNQCDWAFTFEYTRHPRHFRLPLWGLYADPRTLVKPPDYDPDAVLARKTKFCAFIVSNPLCPTRNEFFRKLSKYKPVDSGGKVLNTLGHRVADKRAFLADYKFTIAFENEMHPGYTTEKVMEPMLVDTVPIYWGDPLVGRDFDTRSFLSAHDSPSLDDLIERVIEVDRNPDLHRALLARPWFRDNKVPRCVDPDAILEQFTRIFETPIEPVARRRSLGRLLGLHRLPAEAASIRRRVVRKYRKLTRND